MRVVYHLPNDDLRQAQSEAAAAEAAGFDGVVALENAHGPFPPLAVAALATARVQIGTAVAIAFPRSPTITAHAAWDLNKASDGRFYLGLGSQVKGHNERRYGIPWTPPAPRMRDYIGAVRAVWRAWETEEPLDYHSDSYDLTLTTPNFSPRPLGLPPIPIAMSAVGPAMLRVAGEVADGVRLHPFSTRRYLQEASLVRIGEGLERSGRMRSDIEVVSGAFVATGARNEAVAKMREYIRFRIAFYCSTRAYWHVLRLHDMEELGEKLRPLPAQGRWDEMAAMISDDVVELFAVVGTHDEIGAKIADRYGGLADTLSLFIPTDTDPGPLREVARDIQRIPTPFTGYKSEW
ncbi:MAG: TIGR03617 family F420-dependent LLM class oxidoreductase [Rhodospirillaceae bacterium]|jgi:probable F420-dependent oxidoreductase|nr:TIGR03617 family F420-dependent LLM class oxidoreductase [Rhodospirillaceae bacterium]MBT4490064.1 TIGR03617 family F420-dependent LLM class oxidoreductase [Rhodospirillaceae bacterium]MBT5190908.1 TIGR03617 family F420-dependent LLM class oxidoreductase [Rhodospirillaceae bacterium]MBT5898765.1 TIGR03617 family F420-dependent LLM class oxidoreductase [Rhodospirillaceae bacterium]MBT7758501.1 TIGR03617 family F420-dependent LLM class oxidoreductase [Rhodospirillaceae bacterium]